MAAPAVEEFEPPSSDDEDEEDAPVVVHQNGATKQPVIVGDDDDFGAAEGLGPLTPLRPTNGAGVDFGALEEHYDRYVKAVGSFTPTGNAELDAARYEAFEGEVADAVRAFRDDDGDLAHPLRASLGDRRPLRKYLHRLLKATCLGGAAAHVQRAAHGDQAVAFLRAAYDARFSERARSRVAAAAGRTGTPFADLVWGKHYKFTEPENGGLDPKYTIMEVKAKNGTIVRETSSMNSDVVTELPRGALVLVHRRATTKHNGKDVTRCGIARPCHGYVSAKMLQDTKRKPEKSFFDLTPQDVAWQKEKAEKEAAEAAAGGGGDDDRGNE